MRVLGCPERGRLGQQHRLALRLEPARRRWAPPPERECHVNTIPYHVNTITLPFHVCVSCIPIRKGFGIAYTTSSPAGLTGSGKTRAYRCCSGDPLRRAGRRLPISEAAPDFPTAWALVHTPAVPHFPQHQLSTQLGRQGVNTPGM